jgi:aryl-alcohol dehydrogenase-like predicted oxidoreductase
VRTRRLGPTSVSAIGAGDLCLATSASRGVPAREVEHALHEAIGFGVSLLDVAADADSEKLAGEVVRAERARDRVVVATRIALLDERPEAPSRGLRERLPVAHVQHRVEAALRATRLEALPLAQLPLRPAWLGSAAWPELVGTCARLVREGKVVSWGALVDEPEDEAAPALAAEPWLAALSVVYHLCDRRAQPVIDAAPRELAVLARRPLAGGMLAGGFGPGIRLPPRDDRNDLPAPTLERIAVAMAQLSALVKREPPAARSCAPARAAAERALHDAGPRRAAVECGDVAELALRYVLDRAIALPRLHRRAHLLPGIAAAAAAPLPADLAAQIAQIFDGTT